MNSPRSRARVVCGAGISCGTCRQCRRGRTNLCATYRTAGLQVDGGLAGYVAVPAGILLDVSEVALADDTLALAQPMAIAVHFHEPAEWDGWIRYHHESTHAGAGMSHVCGQVLTEDGRLIASFTQDAMIRAFEPRDSSALSLPTEARL